jgi:uncharacterized protein involved in tellurium resistance
MELKTKVALKQKGEEAFLPVRQLLVKLKWQTAVDLDLMAFYKTKDGRVGGIYSDNYAGGSLGDLNSFPFIQLSGDAGVGDSAGDNEEVLRITKIDEMDTIYICALNFSEASANRETAFNRYDGYVEVMDDKGESFGIPLDASEQGTVAVIAKIDNTNFMGAKLINENRVITLDKFLAEMPGAKDFKLSSKVVLKNKGDSIKIKPKTTGADSGIVVNLNWSQKQKGGLISRLLPSAGAIDLDLGCLFELSDGRKGAIQALGEAFGMYDQPPYIRHLGDDRTGAVSEGEFIKVNGQHVQELKRILFYAFIYEGVANWREADGVVSIKYTGGPEIIVHLDGHQDNMGMCALALFETIGGELQVSKQVRFFHDHVEMDRAYHWDLRWVAGSK